MGIRLLQKFLKEMSVNTKELHLRGLYGKKLAIDVGIYLYRFKAAGLLIENMYLMCSLFKYYNIHPVFVFDGWALEIKRKTLEKRKNLRTDAKIKMDMLMSKNRFQDKKKINDLKKKTICVNKSDYDKVKEFLDAYGMTYITAKREADEVCAALCIKNKTWACLTEDTDIMAYGCQRVLRYFSLIKHNVILYDMDNILSNLGLSCGDFKELCVCSGNDYIETDRNIFYYYDLFKVYNGNSFMDWLLDNKYISIQEYYKRKDIVNLYLMKSHNPFEDIPYIVIKNKKVKKQSLIKILKSERFIFV
jgi:5'-3' exonuclease